MNTLPLKSTAGFIREEAQFVGRHTELTELESAFSRVALGRNELALVEGLSGCGKSRMLDEFCQRLKIKGATVFQSQAQNGTAQRPCESLSNIVSGVTKLLNNDPIFCQRFIQLLKKDAHSLCTVFPDFLPFFSIESENSVSAFEMQNEKSIRAVVAMLDFLGTDKHHTAIILDDMQWADAFTLKVIENWRNLNRRNESRSTLMLIAFRSEDVSEMHAVRRMQGHTHVVVKPFEEASLSLYLGSIAGPISSEALRLIMKLSGGNAFMSASVLRGMIESGMLLLDNNRWIPNNRMERGQVLNKGTEFIRRRIEVLSESQRGLVQCAAVFASNFDLDLLEHSLSTNKQDLANDIEELKRRHMVVEADQPLTFRLVHSKLREAALESINKEESCKLHKQIANALQKLRRDNSYELAYHFSNAGEPNLAFEHAMLAANDARSRYALSALEENLLIALQAINNQPRQKQFELLMELHNVLMLRGNYKEATSFLDRSWEIADSDAERSEVDSRRCEQAIKEGQFDDAVFFGERALRMQGYKIPPAHITVGLWIKLFKAIGIQILHRIFPSYFMHRRSISEGTHDFNIVKMWARLGIAYWWERSSIHLLAVQISQLNLLECYAPSEDLVEYYGNQTLIVSFTPLRRFSDYYMKRALTWSRQMKSLWAEGHALGWYGIALLSEGNLTKSFSVMLKAINTIEQSGDIFMLRLLQVAFGHVIYRSGNLIEARELLEKLYYKSSADGDVASATDALVVWTRVTAGNVPPELLEQARKNITPGNLLCKAILSTAIGIRLLLLRNFDEAIVNFEKGIKVCKENFYSNEFCAPLYYWKVTALRLRIERNGSEHSARSMQLKLAFKAAFKAKRIAWQFKTNMPHALRELAILYALIGRSKKSQYYFEKSMKVAVHIGMRYEHAQSLFEFGRIGLNLNWPEANKNYEKGTQLLNNLGANMVFHQDILK